MEILGEASYNVHKYYPECAGKHPELALSSVCQMRNAVAHGYFKVDYEIV
nr:HepT-like ribonuclease domain-containing protein [Duganella violaceicalia]